MGWTVKGDLSAARQYSAAAGTNDAALSFGGETSAAYGDRLSSTEEYGGAAWSTGGSLPLTVTQHTGCGIQTAALCIGGATVGFDFVANTYIYNGTAWSASVDLTAANGNSASFGTISAAASCGGGHFSGGSLTPAPTEVFNGTTWSASGNMNNASNEHSGSGSQSTGICIGCWTQSF